MIKILNSGLNRQGVIKNVLACSRLEELNGENSLDFSAILDAKLNALVDEDAIFEINNDYFDTAFLQKSANEDGTHTVDVESHHVSYRLNDPIYHMDFFTEMGTPSHILGEILDGTGFTIDVLEYSEPLVYSAQEAKSRRQLLMEFAALLGGDLVFEKFEVSIIENRGTIEARPVIKDRNVTMVAKSINKRQLDDDGNPLVSYLCNPISLPGDSYELGDNVRLIQNDLGINETLRVVSITEDPYGDAQTIFQFANYTNGLESQLYRIQLDTVKKDKLYNGTRIGPTYGFENIRSDKMARSYFNAEEMAFQTGDGSGENWVDCLWLDGSGLLHVVGGLTITSGTGIANLSDAGVLATKDTAVFTSTPTTPYFVGDLWLTSLSAGDGDLKKCITQKLTGAYEEGHWVVASKYTDNSDLETFVDVTYPTDISDLQGLINDKIISWFYPHVPTLLNLPASDWEEWDDREKHLGDLFFDTTPGHAYRFQWDGSFSWNKIEDYDIVTALANASTAQDTADGKRRVFVAQPTVPYDIGDLWSGGSAGHLRICSTSQDSEGAYNIDHWPLATKYTDDETADKKTNVFAQDTVPTSISNNDLWFKTDDGNKCYKSTNVGDDEIGPGQWVVYQDLNKTTTFAQETVPTSTAVGDLWIATTNDNLLYRAATVGANEIVHGQWALVRDGGIAQAVTDAAAALLAADDAQDDADEALDKLADLADDQLITPVEKVLAQEKWHVVVDEYGRIIDQAFDFGVASVDYIDAMDRLHVYLNTTLNLFADMTATTVILRETWNSKWEGYYDDRTKILNAIATKAKTLAEGAQLTADDKRRVFKTTPSTPYNVGDLWVEGPLGGIYVCKTTALTGAYNPAHWELASNYDETQTKIDGGIVTTGTLQVVQGGTVAAGITGETSGDAAVRFFAGSPFLNRAAAPARIHQDGSAYFRKGVVGTEEDRTYYIRPGDGTTSGNNNNDGLTYNNAFLTLDRAFQELPWQVNHIITFRICQEPSDVPVGTGAHEWLNNRHGTGQIIIEGGNSAGATLVDPGSSQIWISSFRILHNTCQIFVRGLTSGSRTPGAAWSYILFESYMNAFVTFTSCRADQNNRGVACSAFAFAGSKGHVETCHASNQEYGISAIYSSEVTSGPWHATGSNNDVGLLSQYASIVGRAGTQPQGSQVANNGGAIL